MTYVRGIGLIPFNGGECEPGAMICDLAHLRFTRHLPCQIKVFM